MAANFLPARDTVLQAWAVNFSARITAAPTVYGLVVGDATALALLVTTYTNALTTATTPSTRTSGTVLAKNTAKVQMVADIRVLAKRIQANPAVTPQMRNDLGLPIHSLVPSPVPPPSTAPALTLGAVRNCQVPVTLGDSTDPSRRAKPAGVTGALLYSFIAPNGVLPPSDLRQWSMQDVATRRKVTVNFSGADVAKVAHFVACWINGKGERGPLSDTETAVINGSVSAFADEATESSDGTALAA